MSSTGETEKSSSSVPKNTEQNSAPAGGSGAKNDYGFRDFLYLDYPKLNSYFAQMRSGLPIEQTTHESSTTADRVNSPEDALRVVGKASAGADVPNLFGWGIPDSQLLKGEVGGEIEYQRKGRAKETRSEESTQFVTTSQLHHAVFTLVLEYLEQHDLVGDGTSNTRYQPFQLVTGTAEFVDFDQLTEDIESFKQLGDAYERVTGQPSFAKDVEHPNDLAFMIKKFYGNRVGIGIYTENGIATAYLDHAHFTAPTQQIIDNFGVVTQIPMTVLGVAVGHAYPLEQTSGEATIENDSSLPPISKTGLAEMAQGMLAVGRGMEGMSRFFRLRGNPHLYPIAVYVDF